MVQVLLLVLGQVFTSEVLGSLKLLLIVILITLPVTCFDCVQYTFYSKLKIFSRPGMLFSSEY